MEVFSLSPSAAQNSDVIHQAVIVGVKPLFALFYAPNMDAVSGKPLYHKGGSRQKSGQFRSKHEHQKEYRIHYSVPAL